MMIHGLCSRTSRVLLQIIVEDALAQAMQLPYSVFASGPYTPPCNEERVAYSNSLNLMDSPPDPQVQPEKLLRNTPGRGPTAAM